MKWVLLDFETTGLGDDCEILECSAHHVSKRSLELKGLPFDLKLIHAEEPAMDPKAREMHEKSGLLAELAEARASVHLGHVPPACVLNYEQFDDALYDFLSITASNKSRSVYLVGNTVSFDWSIVKRRLPRSFIMLSHRVIDVSQHRTVWQAWCGDLVRGAVAHRSRGDLMMSLEGLRSMKAAYDAAYDAGYRLGDLGAFAKEAALATEGDSPL